MKNSRPKIYIKRDLESELNRYLRDSEILAVIGPRQSGKTTLLRHIESKLDNSNFITLENTKTLELFDNDIDTFVEKHVKGYKYLFIDEIQYSDKPGKHLKYIYDTQKTKILITGSSSTELSIKGLKFLVGRALIFYLFPLSFKEFIRFRDRRIYNALKKKGLSKQLTKEALPYFKEFVIYGGYPKVVLEKDNDKKEKILENIYNILMLKDIKEILGIKNRKKLSRLLKVLSLQAGRMINYNRLSDSTAYKYNELKEKMNVLQETFVCKEVRPFYTNKKLELVKNPKMFFFDNGLRNAIISNFTKERTDMGELYENFVFSELAKNGLKSKYWRTKSKAEVDFIVKKNSKIIPIEVKNALSRKILTKSFISFLKKYRPKKGYFLSEDFISRKKFGRTSIHYYPIFYLFRLLSTNRL